jgi:large subunit ribosomal protein L9
MDVILLKDVEKLGVEGAIVHVKPGFARNYLVPAGLALPATPERMQAVESAKQQRARQARREQEQAEALKRRLESRSLTLKLALGAEGQSFGSITAHDIAEALAGEGLPVEKRAIGLEAPIKDLGIVEVPVRLHPAVTATLKVWVVKA